MHNDVKYQVRKTCELRQVADFDECKAHQRKLLRLKDHESNLGEFDVFFCDQCQLGFTDPYPTEETCGYLYQTKNSSDFDVIHDSIIDRIKDYLSIRLLKLLSPHSHVEKILDYATGNGRFAVSAAKAFPSAVVDAVDYQSNPPPLLSNQINSRVNYYSLSAFAEQHKLYDLIILRHVLEHTHHPVDLVKKLSEHLSHDGVLYIEVPNLDSGCAKIFGKYWKLYYVPRHLYHYTIPSLTEVVKRAGLDPEIGRNELPLMGNTFSILTGANQSNVFVQLLGVLLHPLQLLIETWYRSSTCINAKCRHKEVSGDPVKSSNPIKGGS